MIKKCSYFIVITSTIVLITMAFKSVETTLITNDYYKVHTLLAYNVPQKEVTLNEIDEALKESDFSIETTATFIDFKEKLAARESDGDYKAVNSYGYMGKYQFGKGTLKYIGLKDKDAKDFLSDPMLQEKAFVAYVKKNKWILRKEIKKYIGKTIGGILITESGIIAAAHLGGAGSVQDFLRSNGNVSFVDGYGTNIKFYLKAFANYDISEIKADKTPKIITS